MAGEINPNDLSGKNPQDMEVTYHNEEITKAEFNHRLSVFMEKNGVMINANYYVVGTDYNNNSLFDEDVTRNLAYNAEEYFNVIDEDDSGTISMSELNKALDNGYLPAEFMKSAYSIDKVPDNPTNGLSEYKDNYESALSEINGLQMQERIQSQMKNKNFGV